MEEVGYIGNLSIHVANLGKFDGVNN